MASAPVRACEVLLFDLGGVIVELSGVPQWVARGGSRESERLVWERWLRSPTVQSVISVDRDSSPTTPEAPPRGVLGEHAVGRELGDALW